MFYESMKCAQMSKVIDKKNHISTVREKILQPKSYYREKCSGANYILEEHS